MWGFLGLRLNVWVVYGTGKLKAQRRLHTKQHRYETSGCKPRTPKQVLNQALNLNSLPDSLEFQDRSCNLQDSDVNILKATVTHVPSVRQEVTLQYWASFSIWGALVWSAG